ncbi:MAG: glycosyltransferase, partial [Pyrinomonadaceae bacterium]
MSKKIVISTFGSFGDVHPYIAIALELKRRGHRPLIATSDLYREKMDALGLDFCPVRPKLPGHDQPDEVQRMVAYLMDAKRGPQRMFSEMIIPHLRDTYDDLSAATAGADLLLTHPLPFVGPLVARKTGVRWASSVLAPMSLASAYDPPVPPQMPAAHKLFSQSPLLARAALAVGKRMFDPMFEPLYQLRAELGLPRRDGHPAFEGQHSPALVLALFSALIGAPQPDWPANTVVTGFCFYDRLDFRGEQSAPPELLDFLDAGPPPVLFTLGSSAFWVAQDFYRESITAARTLGRRALLLIGEARNRPAEPLPEEVAAFDYAPYGEVMPRCEAIVHQGGIGTTAQALRAGRPTLVVPFAFDQHDNAE